MRYPNLFIETETFLNIIDTTVESTFWKTQVTHSIGESFAQQDLILRERSSRA